MMSTNARAIYTRMTRRVQAARSELGRAAREIAPVVHGESKRIMVRDIYSVPIPLKPTSARTLPRSSRYRRTTTKGKHGRWQRGKGLLNAEAFRVTGMTVWLTNNQIYALARYYLGTSRGRRIRTPGVRSVQWQEQAVARKRKFILETRRQAVLRLLRRR